MVAKEKVENVRNIIELSIEYSVRINRILDSIYLKTKKKMSKKQFFQKAILDAVEKAERELMFQNYKIV